MDHCVVVVVVVVGVGVVNTKYYCVCTNTVEVTKLDGTGFPGVPGVGPWVNFKFVYRATVGE
jgi:hypothetical protein